MDILEHDDRASHLRHEPIYAPVSKMLSSQQKPKSILFITPSVTLETASGGALVTLERLAALTQHHDVTVLTMFADDAARTRFPDVVWAIAGTLRPRTAWNLVVSQFQNLPLSVWRNKDEALLRRAAKLSEQMFDLLYVDHWLMIEAANQVSATHRILHLHNAEPEIFFRAAKRASFVKGGVMRHEGRRSAAYLRAELAQFDALHLLSSEDEKTLALRGISHPKTKVFLPSVAAQEGAPNGFETRNNTALFVGTLSWYANQEGLSWYAENVVPRVARPIHHHVVGGGGGARLHQILGARSGLTLHGYVEDLDPYYQEAKCLVAPLLSGSGIKIKIINALARGLPVVTTPCGVEGFPRGYGSAILVEDTPEGFAASVHKLMSDPDLWQAASRQALAYFQAHFQGQDWTLWAKGAGQ